LEIQKLRDETSCKDDRIRRDQGQKQGLE